MKNIYKAIEIQKNIYINNLLLEKGDIIYVQLSEKQLKEYSISDWSKHGISGRNKQFYQIRQREGNTKVYLMSTNFSQKDGSLLLTFYVTPTYLNKKNPHGSPVTNKQTGAQKPVQVINRDWLYRLAGQLGKGSVHRDEIYSYANYYTIQIKFVDIKSLIKTSEDWNKLAPKEKLDLVQKMIDGWEGVQFFSNSPDYFWQGCWYRLEKTNSAIYPFPKGAIDTGKWGARHGNHDFYLTKHFPAIFSIIAFWKPEIVKAINKAFPVHHI